MEVPLNRIVLFFTLLFFATASIQALAQSATLPPFTEAQVFEWWDDGIITSEEADEIFSKIEEENYDEACLLAEVYAQEPCATTAKNTSKATRKAAPPLTPHGRMTWKGQYDSEGHLKKHREELQLQFYYFKLHLGSQELLSYRRDNFEAHFGQVSTSEFHSHIPLDTLWGTTLLYPIGRLRLGVALDTSKTFQAKISFHIDRSNEIECAFWKFPDANAIATQARTKFGQISVWHQFGHDLPLIKIQLQNEKKKFFWKTTAYIHGDSIPQGLNLSKGITENWLWASQTLSTSWPEFQNTALSVKTRILSPTATDSISARFKIALETGPQHLRTNLNVTCIEASENCDRTEWTGSLESAWEHLSVKASAQVRHTTNTNPPKLELGASYQTGSALAKIALSFPETTPTKSITLLNEIRINSDWLNCNFVFAFKKTKTKTFMPNYAHLQFFLIF